MSSLSFRSLGGLGLLLMGTASILSSCSMERPTETSAMPTPSGVDIGVVKGQVVSRLNGLPLEGITVGWNGTTLQTLTDENGQFAMETRAGFSWLRVEGDGVMPSLWKPTQVLRVWPTETQPDDEMAYLGRRPQMDGDPLDDEDLTDRAREILRKDDFFAPDLPARRASTFVTKQAVSPPATVRVYRRGPEDNSCAGRVDVMPLEEYVRGVVPHEWIPSWHEESLRAGAIAARSYAWGWILAGGKYDCADIDDSTRSQVYEDSRNPRADVAVMSTSGVGIFDPARGQVIRSEYSAENSDPTDFGVCEPLCTGRELFGHGRGMCQWGTQRWANNDITQAQSDILASCAVNSPPPIVGTGQIAEWMVSHYFPGRYTSALEEQDAVLDLSQGMTRTAEFSCSLPERGFGCADFVAAGSSRGIFDMFTGQGVLLRYRVANLSQTAATNVVWKLLLPSNVTTARIATVGEVERNGQEVAVRFVEIPGETTHEIELEVVAVSPGRATFRPFIAEIENLYDKRTWDESPIVNVGQTFNDGDLRQLTEIDVFDPKNWDFGAQPDLNPLGWSSDNADLSSSDGFLSVLSSSGDGTVVSPHLYGDRNNVDAVIMRTSGTVVVGIRYSAAEDFETLGSGRGTQAYPLDPQRSVFQLSVSGATPFTLESVKLAMRVTGEGGQSGQGGQAGQLDQDVGFEVDARMDSDLSFGGESPRDGSIGGGIGDGAVDLVDGNGIRNDGCVCTFSVEKTPPFSFTLFGLLAVGLCRRRR